MVTRSNQLSSLNHIQEGGFFISLKILYEDDVIIVCEKPPGVATQTKRIGEKDMESMLRTYRTQKGEQPYIGVVHRLDQPVKGVMVFAKTKEAAADLSRQVAAKLADKFYYAMVAGVPEQKEGTLEDYLLRDGKTNTSKVVPKETTDAKRAELSYEILKTDGKRSILRIKLETGRHHQIRVQLSNAGWPLVGDRKYNGTARREEELALCSYKIGFAHPGTHRRMEFEIDMPFQLT